MNIKQGDAYPIEIAVKLDGSGVDITDVARAEFYIGGIRKTYPEEAVYEDGVFRIPLSQQDTFTLSGSAQVDVRVKFRGGTVIGIDRKLNLKVADATSEEVL